MGEEERLAHASPCQSCSFEHVPLQAPDAHHRASNGFLQWQKGTAHEEVQMCDGGLGAVGVGSAWVVLGPKDLNLQPHAGQLSQRFDKEGVVREGSCADCFAFPFFQQTKGNQQWETSMPSARQTARAFMPVRKTPV